MAYQPFQLDETREYFDPPEELRRKVQDLAGMIRKSSHTVGFTGAGISTSAGIPDFRSGIGTALETGAGVWELAARNIVPTAGQRRDTPKTLGAIPTLTHMMFVELEKRGQIKHLISQNTDGLHRRSGFPSSKLSELHGNLNLEQCCTCGKSFQRDFSTRRQSNKLHDHVTGRTCHCGGALHDTIINFGESLPRALIDSNLQQAAAADLCLVMGSSLNVAPAADIPTLVKINSRPSHLVIVNLQETSMDVNADLVIHAKCDDVAQMLMEELGIAVPRWQLHRKLLIDCTPIDQTPGDSFCTIVIECRDREGSPLDAVKDIEVFDCLQSGQLSTRVHEIPFGKACAVKAVQDGQTISIVLNFFCHYNEPPLTLPFALGKHGSHAAYLIGFDPLNVSQGWEIVANAELR